MLSRRLKTRDRTLGRAHAAGYGFLRKARASASGQHFMRERVFDFKGFICFAKAAALGCPFQKRFVVMAHRIEFQISHFQSPSIVGP
jgi:hypothetical protein